MLTKSQIVKAVLAGVVAHDMITAYKTRKRYAETLERNIEAYKTLKILSEENQRLTQSLAATEALGVYLFGVLNRHDIAPDEFDRIVVSTLR